MARSSVLQKSNVLRNETYVGGNSDVGQFREWQCTSLGNYSIEKGICANSFVSEALVA